MSLDKLPKRIESELEKMCLRIKYKRKRDEPILEDMKKYFYTIRILKLYNYDVSKYEKLDKEKYD